MGYFDSEASGQGASERGSGSDDEPDQRFCILNPELREMQQVTLAPERDGLLQRIEHQLGSIS
ncbi:MAG: hypothetical protein RIG84_09460 [Roseovarius sp.]